MRNKRRLATVELMESHDEQEFEKNRDLKDQEQIEKVISHRLLGLEGGL
jgi:hypothetical protein